VSEYALVKGQCVSGKERLGQGESERGGVPPTGESEKALLREGEEQERAIEAQRVGKRRRAGSDMHIGYNTTPRSLQSSYRLYSLRSATVASPLPSE